MHDDPHRRAFLEASARAGPSRGWIEPSPWDFLLDAMSLVYGQSVLAAGAAVAPMVVPIKSRLGLAGRLLVSDPDPQALSALPLDEGIWSVRLLSQAFRLPLMESSLDAVILWSSVLGLGNIPASVREFCRVLKDRGRVFVVETGDGSRPRPCPFGLKRLFAESGFDRLDMEERAGWFFFRAEKSLSSLDPSAEAASWPVPPMLKN
jgi:ubiquinone/menaquinone biosynthesis C-methylase UbiE